MDMMEAVLTHVSQICVIFQAIGKVMKNEKTIQEM